MMPFGNPTTLEVHSPDWRLTTSSRPLRDPRRLPGPAAWSRWPAGGQSRQDMPVARAGLCTTAKVSGIRQSDEHRPSQNRR